MFPDLLDIYNTLCNFAANHASRVTYAQFRSQYLKPTLVKQAFDTRRINQNVEFNPRRNLQYYQRSEPYMDNKVAEQVKLFFKVKNAADDIKEQFIGEPDWLDSFTRVLCNAADQTLRVEQKDFDYSKSQLDYFNELLYVRYRLRPEDLEKLSVHEIKNIILNKDEKLLRRSVFVNYQDGMNKNSTSKQITQTTQDTFHTQATQTTQDTLIEKLFGNVKASQHAPEVERSVTITIKDKINDDKVKKES